MKILFCTVELAPYAKVGGLADVAYSLPKALKELKNDAQIAIPAYPMLLNNKELDIKKVSLPKCKHIKHLYETTINSCKVWLIEPHNNPFKDCKTSNTLYSATRDAYLSFSEAVFEACLETDWMPDIIHCNDWHTGFIPLLHKEKWSNQLPNTSTVFTIHNLAYQGEFGPDTLDAVDLPSSLFDMDKTESYGMVNFIKTGCSYADAVNTVSEKYAEEIQHSKYGCRLEGLMSHLASQNKLYGIVNGIDTDYFNPHTDPRIPHNFTAKHLKGKNECKEAILKEMKWKNNDNLLATMITRLSSQKGFHYILESIPFMEQHNIQLTILAKGDEDLAEELTRIQKEKPHLLRIFNKFDNELAHKLYAGSDMIFMPSNYEPCGLGQMIAMQYGTLPLVRKTGGLADTVQDLHNGFTFEAECSEEFQHALARAIFLHNDKTYWNNMIKNAMKTDFTWKQSAKKYMKMYKDSIENSKKSNKVLAHSA